MAASSLRLLVQGPVGAPEVRLFAGDSVVIGRGGGAGAAIDLSLGDAAVSRRHARIWRAGRRLMIEDLGSRGGTWCATRRVTGPRRITDGEVVRIGPYRVTVRLVSAGEGDALRAPKPSAPASPASPPRGGVEAHAGGEAPRAATASPRTGALRRALAGTAILLCALLGGVALADDAAVATPLHGPPNLRCREGERRRLEAWAIEAGGGPLRAAAAHRWASARGCEGAAIEGLLHRALARAESEAIAATGAAIRGLAGVGAGAGARLVIEGDRERLRIDLEGPARAPWTLPGGPARGWARSRDGRVWASIAGPGRLEIVDLAEPVPSPVAVEVAPTARAVVVDPSGHAVAVIGDGVLEIWRDDRGDEDGWRREELAGLPRPPSADDALALGLGGLVSAHEGALWWQRAGGRARSLGAGIRAWALDDDGEALISADSAGVLRRWQWRRGRLRGETIARLGGAPRALCTLDEGRVAVLFAERLEIVELGRRWRPGEALTRARALGGADVDRLLCDPAGGHVIALGEREALSWRLPGETARVIRWRGATPSALAIVGDALIEGDARGRVRRWPLDGVGFDGAQLDALGADEGAGGLRGGGGGWSALARGDTLRVVAARPGGVGARGRRRLGEAIEALAIDRSGSQWLAAGSRRITIGRLADGLRDRDEGAIEVSGALAHGLDGAPLALGFLAAGSLAFAVDAGGGVALWRSAALAEGGGPLRAWGGAGQVSRVAAAQDGSTLAIAERGGTIRVLHVDEGEVLLAEHEGGVVALAVDPAGRWVASGGDDRRVLLAGRDGGQRTSVRLPEVARAMTFVGDRGWVALGTDRGAIAVLRPGAPQARVLGRHGQAAPLALVADGERRLISIGVDGSVWLWSLAVGEAPALRERVALAPAAEPLAAVVHDAAARRLDRVGRGGEVRALFLDPEALIDAACRVDGEAPESGGPIPTAVLASLCLR